MTEERNGLERPPDAEVPAPEPDQASTAGSPRLGDAGTTGKAADLGDTEALDAGEMLDQAAEATEGLRPDGRVFGSWFDDMRGVIERGLEEARTASHAILEGSPGAAPGPTRGATC